MSASQRTKGAVGEREWRDMLKAAGYATATRNLGQSRDGGGDIIVGDTLYEVKRRRGIASDKFMAQAVAALAEHPGTKRPVVAMRADHGEWTVVLRAADYFALLQPKLEQLT